jgi:hypothetical protein
MHDADRMRATSLPLAASVMSHLSDCPPYGRLGMAVYIRSSSVLKLRITLGARATAVQGGSEQVMGTRQTCFQLSNSFDDLLRRLRFSVMLSINR